MIWVCAGHLLSLPMQDKCDRFAFSNQELERAVSEMTAHTKELEKQLAEKEEKCQLLEVPSSHTPCTHMIM